MMGFIRTGSVKAILLKKIVNLCSCWRWREKDKTRESNKRYVGSWSRGCRVTHWSCRVSTLRRRWSSGRPHSKSPQVPSPHSASLSASGREERRPEWQIRLWFPFPSSDGTLDDTWLTDGPSCPLTTTFPLCVLTDAPNHWCDLNSTGSLVPFTFIILLSVGDTDRDGGSGRHHKRWE